MYYEKYPGTWGMRHHDAGSDLYRWFNNWKVDKYEILCDVEWLTIEEYSWSCRGRKITRYDGVIGADHHPGIRKVRFEVGAPPPPTFMQPARKKYVPPPPEPPMPAIVDVYGEIK